MRPSPSHHVVVLMLLMLLGTGPSPAGAQQEPAYRILITNDDGIDAPGIAALAETLSGMAEITVVAPAADRSGSSHATEVLEDRTRVTPYRRDGEVFGFAVDGTPADAVRFGLLVLGAERPFDLVVSGINDGENVGFLAHLSGTIGAAMEALWHDVPAIAVSQSRRRAGEYATAAGVTARIVAQVRARGLPPGVLLSINVPGGPIGGVVAAPMAESAYRVTYVEAGEEDGTTVHDVEVVAVRPRQGGDTKAFAEGFVTITPLRFDWTDGEMLGMLGDWDLSR